VTGRLEAPRDLEAVDVRQLNIEQDDRRDQATHLGHRALAVGGLADHLVALRRE
jgi:hypothetical protein